MGESPSFRLLECPILYPRCAASNHCPMLSSARYFKPVSPYVQTNLASSVPSSRPACPGARFSAGSEPPKWRICPRRQRPPLGKKNKTNEGFGTAIPPPFFFLFLNLVSNAPYAKHVTSELGKREFTAPRVCQFRIKSGCPHGPYIEIRPSAVNH